MNRRIRGKINSGEVGALYDNGRKNKTTAKCKWVYTRNACRKNECVPFGDCKMGSGKLKLFGLKNRDSKVRLMKIIEVKENKKQYLDLLLLADKQEDIEGIFVSDEMQSCGIGKLLLDYIKDKKVSLRLNVYQKNARAISFYQREGFIIQCEDLDEDTGEKEYTMLWKQK